MKIKDCIKGFEQGVSKVIPPEQTYKIVLQKLRHTDLPLLKAFHEIRRPSKIPQFRFIGTDYYQEIVQKEGTNGKGHSQEQALASGLMELVERYSCFKFLFNRGSSKICVLKELWNASFRLQDFCSNSTDRHMFTMLPEREFKDLKIRWYLGYTLHGKRVYLPATMIKAFTNGFAAGNSLEEALLHAICEVIERHCLTLIETNRSETPFIDIDTIKDPDARKLINSFLSLGNEVLVRDFSLGIGLPVIGVVRKISKSDCLVTCGAATCPEEALLRALTESSQGEGNADTAKRILSAGNYFSRNKKISMADIPGIGDKNMKIELERIEKILERKSMKISFVDATDRELGIASVIVFISNAKYYRKIHAFRNILMSLIEELLATHNYRAAEKYIKRGEAKDKKNRLIYLYYKGKLLMGKKEYREAARHFMRILLKTEIKEVRVNSLVNLCFCHLALNEIGSAAACYVKIMNWYPEDNVFGNYGYEKFYFNKILFEISKRHKLYAGDRPPMDNLCAAKDCCGLVKPDELRAIFKRRRHNKKKYYRVFQMAYEYFRHKQYKKTIDGAKEAMALAPEEIDAYLLLAGCYERIRKFSSALNAYNKALKGFPCNGSIYLGLASSYFRLAYYKESIENAKKAINLGYKNGNAHFLAGICYEKSKQYKKAIAHLKKAQKAIPDDPQPDFSLSNCYRKIGRMQDFHKVLERGMRKFKKRSG